MLAQVRMATRWREEGPEVTKLQELHSYKCYEAEEWLNKLIRLNRLNGESCGDVRGEEAEAQKRGRGIRKSRVRVGAQFKGPLAEGCEPYPGLNQDFGDRNLGFWVPGKPLGKENGNSWGKISDLIDSGTTNARLN
jgi:hypothetical protein